MTVSIDRRGFALGLGLAPAATRVPVGRAQSSPVLDEVRSLRAFAEATHPRGAEARQAASWQSLWRTLEQAAPSMRAGQLMVGMRRALGWFRDGHTTILPTEFSGPPAGKFARDLALRLPFTVAVHEDGAFVTATSQDLPQLMGRRLLRVGRMTCSELISEVARGWPGNPAWAHRWSAAYLTSPALLHALGAIDHPDQRVVVEMDGGTRLDLAARAEPEALTRIQRAEGSIDLLRRAAGGSDNFVSPLAGGRAILLAIDAMEDGPGAPFAAFAKGAAAVMASTDAERLIVDLRRNGGGDNFLCEPLRRSIVRSRFNSPGKLYLLIGPQTFSAAQNFTTRTERDAYAIFVGSPSGGAPNHFGDAKPLIGKATGLTAIVSTRPWFDSYPVDRREWIFPDIPVSDRFDDWKAGRDPALEAALAHRPSAADISAMTSDLGTYAFGRPSQAGLWRAFWRG